MHRILFGLLLGLFGCGVILIDVEPSEVWMAQQFEWGDRCDSVVETPVEQNRPLVLSWLEEEGIHPLAVERRAGVTDAQSCWAHRETVYVQVRGEDAERLDGMGFTLRLPPAR